METPNDLDLLASEAGDSNPVALQEFYQSYEAARQAEQARTRAVLRQAYERFMGINPYYCASALLLLFGIYRVSVSDKVFQNEWFQLSFNFGALQLYELLAVAAAVFLARRKIWYETIFLVGLESLLALVAFILISHAVFINRLGASALALAGVCLVCGRYATLKRRVPSLNLPPRLLLFGCGILLVNALMAPWFRSILEHNNEGWKLIDRALWCAILPAMLWLVNCLPAASVGKESRSTPLIQKSWLPHLILLTWVTVSAVHVYSIGYVDDRTFAWSTFAVIVWVAAWTLALRIPELLPNLPTTAAVFFRALPYAALAWPDGELLHGIKCSPALITTVGYAVLSRNRAVRPHTIPLAIGSLIFLLGAVPEGLRDRFLSGLTDEKIIALAVAWPVACWFTRQKTAHASLGLAIWTAFGILVAFDSNPFVGSVAFQAAIAVFLMHSMRWPVNPSSLAVFIRRLLQILWLIYAFASVHGSQPLAPMIILAAATATSAAIRLCVTPGHHEWWVLASSTMVALALPIDFSVRFVWSAPLGILAMLAAFTLLAVGTRNAIKRRSATLPSV